MPQRIKELVWNMRKFSNDKDIPTVQDVATVLQTIEDLVAT